MINLVVLFCGVVTPQDLIHGFDGGQARELYGRGLAARSDYDGDGVRDILLGSPQHNEGNLLNVGKVEIISGATGSVIERVPGSSLSGLLPAEAYFGYAVAAAEDNLGVFDAVYTGAPGHVSSLGLVRSGAVHAWRPASLPFPIWAVVGSHGEGFGYSLDNIGDIDNDGVGDILVGAPWALFAGQETGEVRILSGASGLVLRTHVGIVPGMEFGHTVSALADIDGDGFNDYAVGAHFDDTGYFRAGSVSLYSGLSGSLIRVHRGTSLKSYYGNAIAGVEDLDGDGLGEVLVGAHGGRGKAYVLSGATGSTIFLFEAQDFGDSFGNKVAATDVNMDGLEDLIVAARYANQETGKVEIFSGVDGSLLSRVHGSSPGVRFGQNVASAGDVNGDGRNDWLVWIERASRLFQWSGRAELRSGGPLHTLHISGLQSGNTARVVVGECDPGATVVLAWSLHGPGPIPSQWGQVSLSLPLVQMSPVIANSFGQAEWTAYIPSGAAGRTVWLQGLCLDAGVFSQSASQLIR